MVEDDDTNDTDEAVKSPDEEGDPEPVGDPRGGRQGVRYKEVNWALLTPVSWRGCNHRRGKHYKHPCQRSGPQWQEVYLQNHGKMQKVEKFVGSLANRAQADNDEEAESGDGKNSDLDKLRMEGSWSQAKK